MQAPVTLHVDPTPHAPALVLRPWCAEDATALVGISGDPALRRWTSLSFEREDEGARWIQGQERDWAGGLRFGFAVLEVTGDGTPPLLVGGTVLKNLAPGSPTAEVGYWTAARARGRGVAPRALAALTTWAVDTFVDGGLLWLEALHQVDNEASCRVAEKCGYAYDRTLPATPPDFPLDGHLHKRRAA
ncbi:GNAT family N-acetyltransferase [Streptomyces sp. NPDC004779]|uniref:GNAT family N-acetyltransferase n=1 Tax=Streptomyces sp. NPDC056049 TaxID=3345693 RepID=UPI0035E0475E